MRSLVSAGLRLSKYAPVAGATHSPPMKFLKVLAMKVCVECFRHQGAGAGVAAGAGAGAEGHNQVSAWAA